VGSINLHHISWVGACSIIAQGLKLVIGLFVLVIFHWLGEVFVLWSEIRIPGALVGMLLLLMILVLAPKMTNWVQDTSHHVIQNLSLLFIPICVGAFFLDAKINAELPMLMLTIIISTPITLILLTLLVSFFKGPDDV
jgi:putative effector of murein hydrolase LrgA (UPF0299 family)